MNDFEKIAGTRLVKNDLGVIVNTTFTRDHVSYEVDGVRYLVQFESGKNAAGYVDVFYISLAYREGAFGVKLPQKLIDRMREDLPKAYAARGEKLIILD